MSTQRIELPGIDPARAAEYERFSEIDDSTVRDDSPVPSYLEGFEIPVLCVTTVSSYQTATLSLQPARAQPERATRAETGPGSLETLLGEASATELLKSKYNSPLANMHIESQRI
jgi:hypothetical protein